MIRGFAGKRHDMNQRARQLVTRRLVLRPFAEEDRDAFLHMAADDGIKKTYMLPDLADGEQADAFFERIRALSESERFVYGIYRDGRLVGMLNECGGADGEVEIGYFIASEDWNRGYATEAFGAAIRELFRMGYDAVKAGYFEENPASRRVMEKCGLQPVDEESTIPYRGRDHRCLFRVIRRGDRTDRDGDMSREERIARYEAMADKAADAARRMQDALEAYDAALSDVKELGAYYNGPVWKDDFAADEAGLLPADLRRGVLSEDGLYDLLETYGELAERIAPPRD